MKDFDVIVIGQGYAGLTAAKLAAERGLRTANFEQMCFGGLVLNLNELDPVPEGESHCGAELASTLAEAGMDNGVAALSETVTSITRTPNGQWRVSADSGDYTARNVIVASGARLRKLGVPGEAEFAGQGVSECADCDGPMFKGMDTVVVGGGDSAFQEAVALATFARKVTIIMRGAEPRARRDLAQRVAGDQKISLLPNSQVTAIEGAPGSGVTGVHVRTSGGAEQVLPCSGVFVFIGLDPNSGILPADVERDAAGAVLTSGACAASQPGLWAIGAVRSGFGGMLTDAAQDARTVVSALA